VSVHIRVVGDWTGKMEKLFNPERNLGVGAISHHRLRHHLLLLCFAQTLMLECVRAVCSGGKCAHGTQRNAHSSDRRPLRYGLHRHLQVRDRHAHRRRHRYILPPPISYFSLSTKPLKKTTHVPLCVSKRRDPVCLDFEDHSLPPRSRAAGRWCRVQVLTQSPEYDAPPAPNTCGGACARVCGSGAVTVGFVRRRRFR